VIVAIHQPNYLPWLGYFHKIAAADVFVFLDDVQYTKNSYINRVKILGPSGVRWLTVPVSYTFGDAIGKVQPALPDWPTRHLDTLSGMYRGAPAFRSVWSRVKELFHSLPKGSLAECNRFLVERIAGELKLSCNFIAASKLAVGPSTGDDRLIALTVAVGKTAAAGAGVHLSPTGTYLSVLGAPGYQQSERSVTAAAGAATYLSGMGAAGYQESAKFVQAGLGFRYVSFKHPQYDQGTSAFEPGLSIVDPLFRVGWTGTADLIAKSVGAE